jgi:hypothetical protein
MEADWEVEIGPDAPIIDPCWVGFVDLRREPALAYQLPEALILPTLAEALVKLNASSLPVAMWTAKCDVWPVAEQDTFDPYELDATPEEVAFAWACYIDVLPGSPQWSHISNAEVAGETTLPTAAISWCQLVCKRLAADPLRCCRIDLIIRRALIAPEIMDIGVTAYLTACGATSNVALIGLSTALERFVDGFEPPAKVE